MNRCLGCKREEAIGRTLFEQFPGLAHDRFEAIAAVAQTGEPLRWQGLFVPTGRYYENFYYSPRPGQLAGVFTDITERMETDEAMRESESRFRSLFEHSPRRYFHGDSRRAGDTCQPGSLRHFRN